MSIGANISVIAIGAILSFATHVRTPGFNIPAMGAILMAVGVVGLALQLASLIRQRELTAADATRPRAVVVRPNDETAMDAADQDGGF
jgi:hypothetical protein